MESAASLSLAPAFANERRGWAREWLLFAVLLAGVFYPFLSWMFGRWMAADSYTSHGLLVPLISGWFVYNRWPELRNLKREPSTWGLALLIFGLTIFVLSGLLRVYFTSGIALLLCLTGMLAYWGGWRWVQRLWFPLFFLLFMLPLPEIAIARMNLHLKLFVTHAAVLAVDAVGVPVVMEGAKLHLENGELIVGDVCSGLRSMAALVALGVLFAYSYGGKAWLVRVALLVAIIPVAMLANLLRIFLNILFVHWFGQELLFRPLLTTSLTGAVDLHLLSGFLVFVFALLGLWATLAAAEWLSGVNDDKDEVAA